MIKRPFCAGALPQRRTARRGRLRTLADYALAAAILGLLVLVAARFDRVATLHREGLPAVNDGDTITLAGERIRLQGIDAPELAQTCVAAGQNYSCGKMARGALAALIGPQTVSCSGWERDRYQRLLAICETAGGVELNRRLVEQGWALSYGGYRDEENAAKDAGAGLWAGSFERPRDWRVQHGALVDSEHDLLARIVNWLREIFRQP